MSSDPSHIQTNIFIQPDKYWVKKDFAAPGHTCSMLAYKVMNRDNSLKRLPRVRTKQCMANVLSTLLYLH